MPTLLQKVRLVGHRRQLQQLWQDTSLGMIVGGSLACLLAGLRSITGGPPDWAWLLFFIVAGPVGGGIRGLTRPSSLHHAALDIDRHCGLQDRTSTAVGFLSAGTALSPVQRLQVADAEQHLAGLDLAKAVPIASPRWWPLALSLIAAAIIAAGLTRPESATQTHSTSRAVVREQAARLLDHLQHSDQDPANLPSAELTRLQRELQDRLRQLQASSLDPQSAIAELSEIQASLQAAGQSLSSAQTTWQLQQIGDVLSLAAPMAEVGKALSDGDLLTAADQLRDLALPELDSPTTLAMSEDLQRLLAQADATGMPPSLREALRDIHDGLVQRDREQFTQGVASLADECREQSRRQQLSHRLQDQMAALQESKAALSEELSRQQNAGQQGGSGAGRSPGSNAAGRLPLTSRTGPRLVVSGQDSGAGRVTRDSRIETAATQEALRQYRRNMATYDALRETALETEPIPTGHRMTIRRYFELIRPDNERFD